MNQRLLALLDLRHPARLLDLLGRRQWRQHRLGRLGQLRKGQLDQWNPERHWLRLVRLVRSPKVR